MLSWQALPFLESREKRAMCHKLERGRVCAFWLKKREKKAAAFLLLEGGLHLLTFLLGGCPKG